MANKFTQINDPNIFYSLRMNTKNKAHNRFRKDFTSKFSQLELKSRTYETRTIQELPQIEFPRRSGYPTKASMEKKLIGSIERTQTHCLSICCVRAKRVDEIRFLRKHIEN